MFVLNVLRKHDETERRQVHWNHNSKLSCAYIMNKSNEMAILSLIFEKLKTPPGANLEIEGSIRLRQKKAFFPSKKL